MARNSHAPKPTAQTAAAFIEGFWSGRPNAHVVASKLCSDGRSHALCFFPMGLCVSPHSRRGTARREPPECACCSLAFPQK